MVWLVQIFARHNLKFTTFLGIQVTCLIIGLGCSVAIIYLLKKKKFISLYRDGLLKAALISLIRDLLALNGKEKIVYDNGLIVGLLVIERTTWITPWIYVLFSGEALAWYIQALVWFFTLWIIVLVTTKTIRMIIIRREKTAK